MGTSAANESADSRHVRGAVVPLTVEGQQIGLWVESVGGTDHVGSSSDEVEVAWRRPTLDGALAGMMGMAKAIGAQLAETGATRASVEFGCDFTVESGTLVAVIGKAASATSFKVSLEWEAPR